MDRSRLGNLHGNNNSAPPKKRLKPLFANHQQHGRLVKDNIDGTTTEFIYNNFVDDEEVHTAIVGDSIFDSICVKNCVAYSLSGGKVNQFFVLLDTLAVYRNVILAVGGNNLAARNGPGEEATDVLEKIRALYSAIRNLSNRPRVIVCTVLKRNCTHFNIQRFNAQLSQSNLPFFKLHKEVHKARSFLPDGVHLNEKGRKELACAINKAMRENHLN